MPVTFTPEQSGIDFDTPDEPTPDGLPFDISGVDLTAPPGFAGDLARWIEDQSRRPRKRLAVAGALTPHWATWLGFDTQMTETA
jgi:hypothetical protein